MIFFASFEVSIKCTQEDEDQSDEEDVVESSDNDEADPNNEPIEVDRVQQGAETDAGVVASGEDLVEPARDVVDVVMVATDTTIKEHKGHTTVIGKADMPVVSPPIRNNRRQRRKHLQVPRIADAKKYYPNRKSKKDAARMRNNV